MDQRDSEEFVKPSGGVGGPPAKIKPLFCETVRYSALRTQRASVIESSLLVAEILAWAVSKAQ